MNLQKMRMTAEHLDRFAKIMSGFMKAGAIVCAVFAVLVLVFGESMFDTGHTTLDLDFVKLHLAPEYTDLNSAMRAYTVTGLAVGSAVLYGIFRGLHHLRLLLAPVKEGRPFEKEVSVQMKSIAWLILIIGAFIQIAGIVCRIFLSHAFPIEAFFASPAVTRIEYVYTMDFGFVLMFCLVMFLSRIFEYGQQLQQESDETL